MRSFCTVTVLLCITAASAQHKPLHGLSFTIQSTSDQLRKSEVVAGQTSGWRAEYLLDFPLTSRLSFQLQLALNHMRPRQCLHYDQQRLSYPEIVTGFVEYLPIGSGALYLGVDLHAGYGFGPALQGSQQKIDVFEQPGFNRFRSGFGAQAGFIFNNGIMLKANARSSGFGNFYNQSNQRYYHNTAGLGIGYLINYRQHTQALKRR